MAKDCWCEFRFHWPGEKKRHKEAYEKAKSWLREPKDSERTIKRDK